MRTFLLAICFGILVASNLSPVLADVPGPVPAPTEPVTSSENSDLGVDEFDDYILPFRLRAVCNLLIYGGGAVGVVIVAGRIQNFPYAFFAAGFACLAIDPAADLLLFHLLTLDTIQPPNQIYALVSSLANLFGAAAILAGVFRMAQLWRNMQLPANTPMGMPPTH